jgi:hypothetical protein
VFNAAPLPALGYITATATDAESNTSEYAECAYYENTVTGDNVVIELFDSDAVRRGRVTFETVASSGGTRLTTPYSPPVPLNGFYVTDPNDPTIYFDIVTTAEYQGNVEVCIYYSDGGVPGPESELRLVHYDGSAWVDVTTSLDTATNTVCGVVSSLSPFVIAVLGTTSVGDGSSPVSFALHASVPNPFNPTTTIRYDVPSGGADVSISIFDVAGRLVRELVNEHRSTGTWSVQWNGDDDRGQRVASGVYFYRMRAGDFVDTKKMVLLK